MVEVEACLGPVVEEGYQETQAMVVVVEVPSRVKVEGVVLPSCQGGAGVVELLTCQGGVAVVEFRPCLVKEVGEEYRRDPVKEERVGDQACLHGLVGVGAEVEGVYLHVGQGEEGQVAEGAHRVLALEQ